MFALFVKEELELWPEQSTRTRSWLTIPEAVESCRHAWMKEALEDGFCRWSHSLGCNPDKTTVCMGMFLCEIPKYPFLELPGVKKPNSKLPSLDRTPRSSHQSVNESDGEIMSRALETFEKMMRKKVPRERKSKCLKSLFSH
ncbi:nudix hydrolase 16, mitochondrial [Corchorus olitorius]|uniref:Nudix hydrolase 16, mitochondrial n=1 Tax=Corchorus olitorius TaxID=93759 RepID=A0A1R3IXM0_9ROSI|nr:nudix hydrolase 16, mitochondrial [Corchorus olitorius]